MIVGEAKHVCYLLIFFLLLSFVCFGIKLGKWVLFLFSSSIFLILFLDQSNAYTNEPMLYEYRKPMWCNIVYVKLICIYNCKMLLFFALILTYFAQCVCVCVENSIRLFHFQYRLLHHTHTNPPKISSLSF